MLRRERERGTEACADSVLPAYVDNHRAKRPETLAEMPFRVQVDTTLETSHLGIKNFRVRQRVSTGQ